MSNLDVRMQNGDMVRTVLKNGLAGSFDLVKPFFAHDCLCHVPESLPYGGIYRGWQGYVEVLEKMRKFFSGFKTESLEVITGDGKVLLHFVLDAGIAENGQHVRMPVIGIWEVVDGKIARIQPFYFDTKRITDLVALKTHS